MLPFFSDYLKWIQENVAYNWEEKTGDEREEAGENGKYKINRRIEKKEEEKCLRNAPIFKPFKKYVKTQYSVNLNIKAILIETILSNWIKVYSEWRMIRAIKIYVS